MVLPLILFYFGRLSVISLVANLLVAAVQPMILLAGTVGLLIGLAGLAVVAKLFLWVAWLGLYWTALVARWSALLPWASIEIATFGWGALLFTYALIFALRYRIPQRLSRQFGQAERFDMRWLQPLQPLMVAGLLLIAGLVWGAVATMPDGRLHLYFLNVVGGGGQLLQTPSGRQILIDGSPVPQRLISELGAVMPFWDRTLDLMVVTQPESRYEDALAAIPQRLSIAHAIDSRIGELESESDLWRTSLEQTETPFTTMESGGWIDLGDGVALWVLWPPAGAQLADDQSIHRSLVLKIVYDDFTMLITGDGAPPDTQSLMKAGASIEASVLQVGASGGNSALYDELMTTVNPQVTILHGGLKLGDTSLPPVELPQLTGGQLLQSGLTGRIHLYTDGQNLWLETNAN
jgi:competence protein ComEC